MDGLRPGEAARLCGVTPHTLIRWERLGLLVAVRTAGGHRRWCKRQIEALSEGRKLANQPTTDRLG
jgi:DNA-binding transcriptional MerR regulator